MDIVSSWTPSLEMECCYLGLNSHDVVVSNPPETTFEELWNLSAGRYIRTGPLLSGLGKLNSQTTTRTELLTRGTHLVGIPPLRLVR